MFEYIQDHSNMLNEYSNIFLKFPLKQKYDHIQNLRSIEKRKRRKLERGKNNMNNGHCNLPEITRSTVHTSFGLKMLALVIPRRDKLTWNWWRHYWNVIRTTEPVNNIFLNLINMIFVRWMIYFWPNEYPNMFKVAWSHRMNVRKYSTLYESPNISEYEYIRWELFEYSLCMFFAIK